MSVFHFSFKNSACMHDDGRPTSVTLQWKSERYARLVAHSTDIVIPQQLCCVNSDTKPAADACTQLVHRPTVAKLTSAARASRTTARMGQDLAAARATILELEHENTALRAVLDRHRAAMREDAWLRAQYAATSARERLHRC